MSGHEEANFRIRGDVPKVHKTKLRSRTHPKNLDGERRQIFPHKRKIRWLLKAEKVLVGSSHRNSE